MARYPLYRIYDVNSNLIFGICNGLFETGLRPSDNEVVPPFVVTIVDAPFGEGIMGSATHITVDFDPTSGLDISLLRLEENGTEPNPLIIDYVEMLYNTNQIGWGYGESYPYILSGGSETPEVTEGVGVSASGGLLLVGEWLVSCPSEIPDGGDDNPPPNYITFTDQMVPVTDVGIEPLGFNHVVPMSGTTSTFDISFDRAITTEDVIADYVLSGVAIYSNDGILVADLGLRSPDFATVISNTEYKGNNTYGLVAPMSTTLSDYNTVVYGTPVLVTNTTGVDLDLAYCRHWLTHYSNCTDPVINTTNLFLVRNQSTLC